MVKDAIILGKRYEVVSKIGAGGMADVYKGKDLMLNRYVAIKVLKKEYKEDEMFVRKFRSEAQAAAGLMNPNIVKIKISFVNLKKKRRQQHVSNIQIS